MSWSEKLSIKIAEKIVPAGEAYTVGQVSHGIELFLLRLLNTAALVVLSALFGCLLEALLISAMYLLIRNFTGGVHFRSAQACLITGISIMVLSAFLVKQLPADAPLFSSAFIAGSTMLSFLINMRYAPAKHTYVEYQEHVKKKNKRITLVLLIFGCVLSMLLLYLNYEQLGHAFSFAVLLQSFFLHPLAYRAVERIESIF
jgi:accessory gene regulator protein AgrB